jgi:DNA polymerase III subunit beta
MKLTVTQENLSRALGTVSRIASNRGSLPILSNVLLRTQNNQLLVAATNLDVAISETIGAKIKTEGSVTVPARLMQDYVASLPSGTLTLEVTENKLRLTTEHHSSSINGTPADDFPEMPTIDKGDIVEIAGSSLKTALQQVLFAASNDDARPVLTGLYLHSLNGKLYAAATDSYRLAEKMITKLEKEVSLLIPASSLQDVLRVMRDDTQSVSIHYDEQQARFSVGPVELVTRLIEGKYPDYRKLLPKEYQTTATLNRGDLQEITKVSSLFAREAAGGVTVTISEENKQVSIKSIASQVGENNAVADAEVSGDAVITMNSRYILDALSAFEGNKIQVNVNGKLDPCILTDPENDDYLHVVMPVKS